MGPREGFEMIDGIGGARGFVGAASVPGNDEFRLPGAGSVELVKDLARDAGGKTAFAEALRRATDADNDRSKSGAEAAVTDRRLLEACYELESIFVGYMLRSMRRTIDESDFFGKTLAKDIFRDMLYDEYAKTMARTDQLGIARQIYNQLRAQ
jgi:flagellar protein FlgJ